MMPLEAVDVASLTTALGACRMDITILGNRLPLTRYNAYTTGARHFVGLSSQFLVRIRLDLPEDSYLFGYLHDGGRGGWCQAVPLRDDCGFLVPPDRRVDLLLRPGSRMSALLVPGVELRSAWSRRQGVVAPLAEPACIFRCSGGPMRERLRRAYEDLWSGMAHEGGDVVDLHLEAAVQARHAGTPRCSRGRLRRYATFCRAVDFMEAHLDEDLYARAISRAVGASERALRYAFQDLTGLSPMRYLQHLRLSHACRALATADASRRSVKSVAITCGLRDLSRFALAYRRVFGEPPHATLARTPTLPAWSL